MGPTYTFAGKDLRHIDWLVLWGTGDYKHLQWVGVESDWEVSNLGK